MTGRHWDEVLGLFRRRLDGPPAGDRTDRQLLERFAGRHDEAAFASLVRRHGALVLGVGRRVLRHDQDAEDVFQATFLILARKAASAGWQESIAGWLHCVAYRLANRARALRARQREREKRVGAAAAVGKADDRPELSAALDEELSRLPDACRAPLVLCHLEGKTRDQAARQLGWSLRTLERRLSQGLKLLRARLGRRGVELATVLLAAGLAQESAANAAATLVAGAAGAAVSYGAGAMRAGDAPPARVVALAESGLKTMALSKLKVGSLVLLAAGLVAVWAGVVGHRLPAATREEPKIAAAEAPADAPPPPVWPEGATVKGRVVDHRGAPVAKAEVLLLGEERVIVEAERRTWFLPNAAKDRPPPPSTKTDTNGEFTIERKKGPADRLLVIADDPLMWVVPRKSLARGDDVAIKLPPPGTIVARCDLPGKAARQPVMIQLQKLDGGDWDADSLRFHFSSSEVKNPGETLFEHLPPGQYAVERYQQTGTGRKVGMFNCDRQLVTVGPDRPASVRFERGAGRPVTGRVRGLEGADLRYAYVSIHYAGPEERPGKDGRRARMITGFDSIPITSDGRFNTDPMPPGQYLLSVFAVHTSTPEWSIQSSDFDGNLAFTVPPGGDVPALELRAKPRAGKVRIPDTDYRVRVVDEAGEPVPAFQALLYTTEHGSSGWTDGGGGVAGLGQESMFRDADALYVLVRADGYAPAVARFEGARRDALRRDEVTITLRRGRKVELRFRLPEGLTWPAGGLPEVYFGECEESVRILRQPANRRIPSDYNVFKLRPSGPGRFEVRLAAETPPIHVAVHLPGFLQHFEAGPFTPADVRDGALTIDVPRAASLDVRFDPGAGDPAGLPFKGVSFQVLRQIRGDEHLCVVTDSAPSVRRELRLTDLAPGTYRVGVSTQSKTESKQPPGTTMDPGFFHDTHRVVLEAGKSGRVDFRHAPFDPLEFRGPRTAVLHVRNPDGTPASGRELKVEYQLGHYAYLTVFAGRIPPSGDVTLKGLTDRATDYCPRQYAYGVNVGGRRLGTFGFTADGPTQEFEFRLPPGAGDPAPDVELRRVVTGESVRLGNLRGKVVCLEFWATWCGPCQPAVAKLNAMSDGLNAARKDQLAIVPVSVDTAPEKVRTHSLSRGWTRLDHFWAGPGEGVGFDAPAARAFVVNGVPEAILIGRDGRIAEWHLVLTKALENLAFDLVPRLAEEGVVFGPPLAKPWLEPVRPVAHPVGRDRFEDLREEPPARRRVLLA